MIRFLGIYRFGDRRDAPGDRAAAQAAVTKFSYNGAKTAVSEVAAGRLTLGRVYWDDAALDSPEGLYVTAPNVIAALGRDRRSVTDLARLLRQMPGAFALAQVDLAIGDLHLAVDHFSSHNIYVYKTEAFCIFATDIALLIACPLVPKRLCGLTFGWKSAMRMDANGARSWFGGIDCLRPGRIVTSTPLGETSEHVYWQAPTQSNADIDVPRDATSATVRAAFDAAFDAQLGDATSVAMMLSGGFDSSVVAATAAERGLALELFHVLYEGTHTDQNHELKHAKLMADALGRPLHVIEITHERMQEMLDDLVWLLGRPLVHGAEFGMYLFFQEVAANGRQLVIGGHAADAVWGSQVSGHIGINNADIRAEIFCKQYLSRRFYQTEQPEWHAFLEAMLYPRLGQTARAVEDQIWEEGFLEYRNFASDEPSKKARIHHILGINAYIRKMTNAISGRFGLAEEHVFLAPDFVALAFEYPEFFLNHTGGYDDKPLLKMALGERLPEQIVNRQKMGFQPPRHDQLLLKYRAALAAEGLPLGMNISPEALEDMPMTQVLFLDSTRRWLELCTED